MSRVPFAVLLGLVGFVAYCVAVVTLADWVLHAAWPLQAVYFVAAGTLWVFPARWLMLWAAHMR
jgi:hypothetical protein